ncbi:CHAP domain-containing protein, partial [Kitasatospora sp. LaBMicrA B282]|uniref:CHAP domain-containing protein n=1 Tax=Kitasatospora sp. LaBMicrA B282 TaxID=3420949 RepID=UPI003D11E37B
MSVLGKRRKLRGLAGLTVATISAAAGLVATGTGPASAATGSQLVGIANANLGKHYCDTNSAGGTGFGSSCSANGGTGEFWCGDFVSWVWQQAGLSVPASNPASVPSWLSTSAYHPLGSGYTPQPGDAVIFGDNQYPTQGSHIAIVTNYSNGLLSDIGGDEGGGGSPWWSTSSVQTDEGNGAAWNPNNHLFTGTSAEMWVLGYVASGATSGPAVPAGFNVTANVNGTSGTINLTSTVTANGYINTLDYHVTGPGYDQTFRAGGGPVSPNLTGYSYAWNSTGLANGTYTVTPTANEIDGQPHSYGPVTFTVNNAPAAPTVTVPAGTLNGNVPLTASVLGGTATSVTYSMDGTPIGTSTAAPGFAYSWDTTFVSGGTHVITATASNSGGSSPSSAGVTAFITPREGSSATETAPAQSDYFGRNSLGHLEHWFWNPSLGGGNWQTQDWGGDLAGDPTGYFSNNNGGQTDVF